MDQTPLCIIMTKHGSDKGHGRHNYTPEYHKLFGEKRNKIKNVFELGIGTTDPQYPNNMGQGGIPSASLRGWKEYFPNATIHGADIDKTTLKNEEKIQTYYVDQKDAKTIQEMWNHPSLKTKTFDIIVDDGQHTLETNINFLKNSIQKLKPKGTYIIEDINTNPKNIQQFRKALNKLKKRHHIKYFIKQMPHPTNQEDNCIIIIIKTT